MYRYDDIRILHVELTDRCNAACPQCPRNDEGGAVNPRLALTALSLADIRSMFPPSFVSGLQQIAVAGNFGDPIVARDTLEIFDYWRSCSPTVSFRMGTNGSARSPQWWRELARIMTPTGGRVVFAIDGLEDTNAVYRRNTSWPVIMRNAAAFIEAGGTADWNFIVFQHNEHQTEAAARLADEMGFRRITFKTSNRFVDRAALRYRERTPIKSAGGQTVDWLRRPTRPEWRPERLGQFTGQGDDVSLAHIRAGFGSMEAYLDNVEIHCASLASATLFVSAEGFVLPCCYLAGQIRDDTIDEETRQWIPLLDDIGGLDAINLKRLPLAEILAGPFFQERLPASWTGTGCDRNRTCARVCGRLDPHRAPLDGARAPRPRARPASTTGRNDGVRALVTDLAKSAGAGVAGPPDEVRKGGSSAE